MELVSGVNFLPISGTESDTPFDSVGAVFKAMLMSRHVSSDYSFSASISTVKSHGLHADGRAGVSAIVEAEEAAVSRDNISGKQRWPKFRRG